MVRTKKKVTKSTHYTIDVNGENLAKKSPREFIRSVAGKHPRSVQILKSRRCREIRLEKEKSRQNEFSRQNEKWRENMLKLKKAHEELDAHLTAIEVKVFIVLTYSFLVCLILYKIKSSPMSEQKKVSEEKSVKKRLMTVEEFIESVMSTNLKDRDEIMKSFMKLPGWDRYDFSSLVAFLGYKPGRAFYLHKEYENADAVKKFAEMRKGYFAE